MKNLLIKPLLLTLTISSYSSLLFISPNYYEGDNNILNNIEEVSSNEYFLESEQKYQPSFNDELIQSNSIHDEGNKTYQSRYSAYSDVITDNYVAKTPEGNYINLSYSDKDLDTEWDVSEVSNIDINHIYCDENSGSFNWDNTTETLDQTELNSKTKTISNNGFYQYIVTDNTGNISYSYFLITDENPNYYHLHNINLAGNNGALDRYMDPWTLYLNDETTESISNMGWFDDFLATTMEGFNYEQISMYKLGYDYYEIKKHDANEVEQILDKLDNYYDFMEIYIGNGVHYDDDIQDYVYLYFIDNFNKKEIEEMTLSVAEGYIKEAIELFISETTGNPVYNNDFNIIFSWQDKNELLGHASGSMVIEPTQEGNWYSSKNFGSSETETPNQESNTVGFSPYDLLDVYDNDISTGLIMTIVFGSIGTITFAIAFFFIYKHHKKTKLVDN